MIVIRMAMTASLKASSRLLLTPEPYEPVAFPRVKRAVIVVVALLAAAGLAAGGWAVFEHFDRAGVVKDSERACGTFDTPDSGVTLPVGVPLPEGAKLLHVITQGKTTVYVSSVEGVRKDVVKVRDEVLQHLIDAGFTKKSTDQEPGYEAEAQLEGRADTHLKVRPLCTDRLEVRLTVLG
jgi:hypothetical protein